MSFQWTFLATFLYCELAVVAILLLPLISPVLWQKFFKSRIATAFTAGATYYFNFIIAVFALLFADSIRELLKYSVIQQKDVLLPQAEIHARMKQFRAQRNFYIAGFALFLWFVIKRLIHLLSECARKMADSAAARKQAEGAHRHVEGLMSNDGKSKTSSDKAERYIDPKEHDAKIEQYKKEALKKHDDIELLRERYDISVKEFEKLREEHRRLQLKLNIASNAESTKTK